MFVIQFISRIFYAAHNFRHVARVDSNCRTIVLSLKVLKSNLRSRMGEERLSALTLACIYSDSFDYRSIAADVVKNFYLMICKTGCTTTTTADRPNSATQ